MTTGTLELPRGIVAGAPPASADLGIRLAATAIDAVIVGITGTIAAIAAHLLFSILPGPARARESVGLLVLGGVVATAYFVYFWGREGATPGKRLLGLRVARPGAPATRGIGFGRAFLRFAGMAAGNILLIDLVVAFLHRDRRALHDLVADTVVLARR